MFLKHTHVDSESIGDGRHIRTHYNLQPLKLQSCSPRILVAASKASHHGTSMIGTAHTWHAFQKIPDWLQISGRVDGGGGLRVEEGADLNREAPSSPLTEYSYSDESSKPAPSKPAHSKKRTKKLFSLHPLLPLPSASIILSPLLKYLLSFHRLPDRSVLFVMFIGDALSTAILKQSEVLRMTMVPVVPTSKKNQPKCLSSRWLENKRKQRYTAHNLGRKIVKHPTSNILERPELVNMSPIPTPMQKTERAFIKIRDHVYENYPEKRNWITRHIGALLDQSC